MSLIGDLFTYPLRVIKHDSGAPEGVPPPQIFPSWEKTRKENLSPGIQRIVDGFYPSTPIQENSPQPTTHDEKK